MNDPPGIKAIPFVQLLSDAACAVSILAAGPGSAAPELFFSFRQPIRITAINATTETPAALEKLL
jgi:hypothetical protein